MVTPFCAKGVALPKKRMFLFGKQIVSFGPIDSIFITNRPSVPLKQTV